MQSKRHSVIESVTNIAVGYVINFIANMLILPLVGFNITVSQNLFIGVLYTGISIARLYLLRRFFNQITAQEPKP